MPHFVDLPIDIHLLVLQYLPPKDIASIRQTSKIMEEVTKTPSVWMDALKRTCLSYGIPFITYDFERMPREELEYAATAPDRFLHSGRRAMDSPSRSFHPIGERRLPLPSYHQDFFLNEGSRDDLVLLPGGRFILSFTDALLVWDLASESSRPFVVMDNTTKISPGFKMLKAHLRTLGHHPARSKVHLAMSASFTRKTDTGDAFSYACVACELDLAASPPALCVLNILHDALPICAGGDGSRILFRCATRPSLLGAWDYEQDTATSWMWDDVGWRENLLSVTDRYVILHDQNGDRMIVYDLPPLMPTEGRIPTPSHAQAVQIMTLPHSEARFSFFTAAANRYAANTVNMTIIDDGFIPLGDFDPPYPDNYNESDPGGYIYVTRFFVSLEDGGTPLKMGETPVITDYVFHLSPPKQTNDKVITVYRQGPRLGEKLWVHSSSLEGPAKVETICIGPREGSFFPEWQGSGTRADYDFCPVTGRLCISRPDLRTVFVYDTMPSYVPVEQE
ncbi:hypothetical protein EV715DRAFT_285317 [Schizophyllum commune]